MSNLFPCLVIALSACATAHPVPTASPGDDADVLARERAWLDACEHNDADVMADMLADDFVLTLPTGHRTAKADVVTGTRRLQAAGKRFPHLVTSGTVAHRRAGVIVLAGTVAQVDEHGGRHAEVLYTDTWIRDGATWRVLASQMTSTPGAQP